MIDILAIICCIILVALAIFQLALILGAPLGKYAWGGQHTVLPMNLRIGSVVSILLYGIIAAIIVSKAELMTVFNNQSIVNIAIWVIAAYFTLGILLNGISRSKYERNLMTPVVLVLAGMTILIALS
jgi:hypothetical protein